MCTSLLTTKAQDKHSLFLSIDSVILVPEFTSRLAVTKNRTTEDANEFM
jgi:hypothetical protein